MSLKALRALTRWGVINNLLLLLFIVSDTSAEETPVKSPRLLKLDHHPIVSPSAMRKLCLHEPSSSQNTLNHRLKPVMEVLDVGRRHSIVGT